MPLGRLRGQLRRARHPGCAPHSGGARRTPGAAVTRAILSLCSLNKRAGSKSKPELLVLLSQHLPLGTGDGGPRTSWRSPRHPRSRRPRTALARPCRGRGCCGAGGELALRGPCGSRLGRQRGFPGRRGVACRGVAFRGRGFPGAWLVGGVACRQTRQSSSPSVYLPGAA